MICPYCYLKTIAPSRYAEREGSGLVREQITKALREASELKAVLAILQTGF